MAQLGQPASSVGFYLAAMPVGAVTADVVAARMLGPRARIRVMFPAALVGCVTLLCFAARPDLALSMAALFIVGLGFAYAPGIDQRLIEVTPAELRDSALAVSSAGLMFVQGVGFAVWGFAAQLAPIRVVIPIAGAIGLAAVLALFLPGLPRRRGAGVGWPERR
jgi:predicted MFS family arabinose efflux permease